MIETRAFAPLYQNSNLATAQVGQFLAGVIVAASNGVAVASTVLPGQATGNDYVQFRVSNKTSVWVHVNFGMLLSGQTVRASALTDPGIAPGVVELFTVGAECNGASVFADGAPAASTSVVFHRGSGV